MLLSLKRKKLFELLVIICCILLLAYTALVIISASFYTVLQADDFSHALNVGVFHAGIKEHLTASAAYARKMYMTWQGTYFSMFIQALLSPLNNWGLPQLRVIMVLNAALFLGSLVFLIFRILNLHIKGYLYLKLLLCTAIIIPFINFRAYTEVFFWFSGATSYSIPLSCLFISIAFLVSVNKRKNHLYLAISMFFGLCSSGGSLAVAGTGCYLVLLWGFFQYMHERKCSVANLICFLTHLAGALINVAAPGNFIRHEAIDDEVRLLKALLYSCKTYCSEIEWILKSTNMVIFILVMVACGIILREKIQTNLKIYAFTSFLGLLTPIVAIFPVGLGYSGINFPNRCVFVVDLTMEIAILNFSFAVGCIINEKLEKFMHKTFVLLTMLLIFTAACTSNQNFSNMVILRLSGELTNGTIPHYYKECCAVLSYIESCEESEVVVKGFPDPIGLFGNFVISEDSSHWINIAIAGYYGKNSVKKE